MSEIVLDASGEAVMLAADEYGLLRALIFADSEKIPAARERLRLTIAWLQADARAGCTRRTKTGTCLDKGYNSICAGCQATAESAEIAAKLQEVSE